MTPGEEAGLKAATDSILRRKMPMALMAGETAATVSSEFLSFDQAARAPHIVASVLRDSQKSTHRIEDTTSGPKTCEWTPFRREAKCGQNVNKVRTASAYPSSHPECGGLPGQRSKGKNARGTIEDCSAPAVTGFFFFFVGG